MVGFGEVSKRPVSALEDCFVEVAVRTLGTLLLCALLMLLKERKFRGTGFTGNPAKNPQLFVIQLRISKSAMGEIEQRKPEQEAEPRPAGGDENDVMAVFQRLRIVSR